MPLGVATAELAAKQRAQFQDRKGPKRTMTLVNPEGVEVEVSIANAHDLLNHVPGWRRPQVPAHIQNPYAHAPRRKRGEQPLYETVASPEPTSVAAQGGKGVLGSREPYALNKAAIEARAAADEQVTADQLADDAEGDVDDMVRGVDTELKQAGVPMPVANEASHVTRKQRNAAKNKSKEDDAEVAARVTGGKSVRDNIQEELAEKDKAFAEMENQ